VIGKPIVGATVMLVCTVTCAVACASQQAAPQRATSQSSAPTSSPPSMPAPSIPTPSIPTPLIATPSIAVAPPTSVASYETQTATPAAPTGAFAHPPETPCVYPADESQDVWDPSLVGLLQESDLMIEADVEDKFQRLTEVGDQVFWSQLVGNVDVLRSRVIPPPTVTGLDVQGDPGKPPYGWTPGRYVLLLFGVENGVSSVSGGMSGMFRIVDGRALRFCPNYDAPAHPIAASGTPPTIDELLALIPTTLPSNSVPPKPTTSPNP
jgi:hypothetical protein